MIDEQVTNVLDLVAADISCCQTNTIVLQASSFRRHSTGAFSTFPTYRLRAQKSAYWGRAIVGGRPSDYR